MRRSAVVVSAVLLAGCGPGTRRLAPILMTPVATLGHDAPDGGIGANPQVSEPISDGIRIVVSTSAGIAIAPMAFSADGKFVASLVVPTNAGVSFHSPIFARVGPGDSIWVFDSTPQALVFDRNRVFCRSVPLPFTPWDAVVLPDGHIVASSSSGDQPLPIAELGANGEPLRAFGDSTNAQVRSPRWLLRAPDGSFWSIATRYRWRLEHWDSNGTSLGVVDDTVAWFPPYTEAVVSAPDTPQPTIQGMRSDSAGRIWILAQVADANWSRGVKPEHPGTAAAVVQDADATYDTMVEVLDPTGRHILLSARLDPSYAAFSGPQIVTHVVDTRHGSKQIDLFRMVWKEQP